MTRHLFPVGVLLAGLAAAPMAWAQDDPPDADITLTRTYPAAVEAWRSLIAQEADGSGVPIDVLLTWVLHESYGNPCALGIPDVEAGIAQTYHPHDDRFGATYGELRAACVPGTQNLARPLTANEKALQVRSLVAYVGNARDIARGQASGAGLGWSESSADFWNLVKLRHALPALGADYLPACRADLGRAPESWAEFREWLEGLSEARVVAINKNVAPWSSIAQRRRLLDNAEKTGSAVGRIFAGE